MTFNLRQEAGSHGVDFIRALNAATDLSQGKSEYGRVDGAVRYVYPPLVALALEPFTQWPVATVVEGWFWVSIGLILLSIVLDAAAGGVRFGNAAGMGMMLVPAFYYRSMTVELNHGQFDLVILALVCAGAYAERRGRPVGFAAAIAVAALIKVWVLGMLVYLVIRRRWKSAALCMLFFVAGLAVLFGIVGFGEAEVFRQRLFEFVGKDDSYRYANMSIFGFARVHFTINHDAAPWVESKVALALFVGTGFAALTWGMWLALKRGATAQAPQARLILALTVVSLLLALPDCERPYLVLLLPAIWAMLTVEGISSVLRAATMGIYLLLTFNFAPPAHRAHGIAAIVPSIPFLCMAGLWALLVAAVKQREARAIA